jgi:large subunit ribosomal protein L24
MNFKKGDNIIVISGKDKGKTGKISDINQIDAKVVIDGVNTYKKHKKPTKQGEKGQIVTLSRAMPASKVAMLCGNCKKGSRVGIRAEGEKKVRYCKRCETAF